MRGFTRCVIVGVCLDVAVGVGRIAWVVARTNSGARRAVSSVERSRLSRYETAPAGMLATPDGGLTAPSIEREDG